jgi:hypothetical protein
MRLAALAPELPKEPGGGAGGMAEGAEEAPGWLVLCVGGRKELKTRGGSLSSEGANGEVQAERPTPIKILRLIECSNAFISNADTIFNIITGAHLHGKRYTRIVQFINIHQ